MGCSKFGILGKSQHRNSLMSRKLVTDHISFLIISSQLFVYFFTVNPCRLCGLPLCPDCAKMGSPKYHGIECKLFETCGMYKSNPVTTYKQAKTIYMYLTPLRLLLKSENNPELMKLSSKLEDRENTLIYFLNAAHVVKPMYKLLGLETRFSELQIQVKNPFTIITDIPCDYSINDIRIMITFPYTQATHARHFQKFYAYV